MFYTYILHSESIQKYYIGSTTDLNQRLKNHLTNHKGYTSIAKDWIIVHFETFETKSESIAREL